MTTKKRTSSSNTAYFDNEEKIEVNEQSHTTININKVETGLSLTGNHPKYYLLNELKGRFDWTKEQALINTSSQNLQVPYCNLSNDFTWIDQRSYSKSPGCNYLSVHSNN